MTTPTQGDFPSAAAGAGSGRGGAAPAGAYGPGGKPNLAALGGLSGGKALGKLERMQQQEYLMSNYGQPQYVRISQSQPNLFHVDQRTT